jgi:hypothetical protein
MSLADIQLNLQKKILIVLFFALIVYVDTSFILKPQRSGVVLLDSKISKLKIDLANLNRGLESMRLAQSKPGALSQKKVAKSSKIFSEGQISGLLQDVSSIANKFDIKILQINSTRQVQPAAKEKTAVKADKLIPLLINLDLTCDYHSLGKFIQELENSVVFIGVESLDISTQLPDYMKQKVTLVLKTYVTK